MSQKQAPPAVTREEQAERNRIADWMIDVVARGWMRATDDLISGPVSLRDFKIAGVASYLTASDQVRSGRYLLKHPEGDPPPYVAEAAFETAKKIVDGKIPDDDESIH